MHPSAPVTQTAFSSASLYVGDLAPEVSEGKLFDIFNSVGPVASIRVCRDAMLKRSLGYAYVNFHNQGDAERALETMNYTQIAGRPCRIMWSQRDPSLRKSGVGNIFVKSLHPEVKHEQLQDTFSLFGDILSCKVVLDAEGKSKGYGYVHFATEEGAQAAIAKLDEIEIMGQKVEVLPFTKKSSATRQTQWTNLYVKNVPLHMTEEDLKQMFAECGNVTSLKLATFTEDDLAKDAASAKPRNPTLGSSKGFGFVAFETHEEAKSAAEKLNNTVVPDPEGRRPTIAASALKAAEEALAKASEDGKEAPAELVEKVAEAKKAAEEEATADVTKTLFVGQAQKKDERQREMRKKFQILREKKMQSYMGVNLFVKNLDDSVDDKQLDAAFSQYGTITSSRVMRNPDGSSKGFGFVCFSAPEEATAASNDMNGKPFAGKPIFVALAQRREQRREMLSAAHMPQGRGPQGGPGMPRGPMGPGGAGMYGPMGAMGMYKQYPGGPGYGMPQMMMQGGRGMPRGPGMPYNQRGQGGGYQMPAYPNGPMNPGQFGPQGQGNRRNRNNQRQNNPGRGQNMRQGPGQQQPNIKFNQQVRNQPGGAPVNMPPQNLQQHQAPEPAASAPAGAPPAQQPFTAASLASAPEHMQKNMIGEQLYPKIATGLQVRGKDGDQAGKITGMLLEMDNSELVGLLESPESLDAKISEALDVLKAHRAGQS